MWRSNSVVPALLVAVLAGCQDINHPDATLQPEEASNDIVDADNGGEPGFYWLPPIQEDGNPGGILATDHYLGLTATVCELAADKTCLTRLVTFTPTAEDPYQRIHMNTTGGYYQLIWRTSDYTIVAGKKYRITVHHSTIRQGWADVYVARDQPQAETIRNSEAGASYIPILVGDVVNVLFRTEEVLTP